MAANFDSVVIELVKLKMHKWYPSTILLCDLSDGRIGELVTSVFAGLNESSGKPIIDYYVHGPNSIKHARHLDRSIKKEQALLLWVRTIFNQE